MSFFQFSEFTSGQDALPTVLNSGSVHTLPKEQAFNRTTDSFSWGHDPFTLACKARPSFDGYGTSLSVSLSLSLSLSQNVSCRDKKDGAQQIRPVRGAVVVRIEMQETHHSGFQWYFASSTSQPNLIPDGLALCSGSF